MDEREWLNMVLDTTAVKNIGTGVWKSVVYGLLISLIISAVVYVFFLMMQRKRYEYVVRVWKKESETSDSVVQVAVDKGGIFLDKKTNNRLFRIKNGT